MCHGLSVRGFDSFKDPTLCASVALLSGRVRTVTCSGETIRSVPVPLICRRLGLCLFHPRQVTVGYKKQVHSGVKTNRRNIFIGRFLCIYLQEQACKCP